MACRILPDDSNNRSSYVAVFDKIGSKFSPLLLGFIYIKQLNRYLLLAVLSLRLGHHEIGSLFDPLVQFTLGFNCLPVLRTSASFDVIGSAKKQGPEQANERLY